MLSSLILKTASSSFEIPSDFLFSLGLSKLENNPDFQKIGEASPPKIEDIRHLKSWLQKKAFSKKPRVALVFQAENLNIQSQNALLKILEEPPPNTYLILLTTKPQSLLPTILSRCQIISLKTTSPKDSKSSLLPLLCQTLLQRLNWVEKNHRLISDPQSFIEQETRHFHQTLKTNPSVKLGQNLNLLNQSLLFLKANLDFKTVLNWLALNLGQN
jgi:hypothetical protein